MCGYVGEGGTEAKQGHGLEGMFPLDYRSVFLFWYICIYIVRDKKICIIFFFYLFTNSV